MGMLRSDVLEGNPDLLAARFQGFARDVETRRSTMETAFRASVHRTAEAYLEAIGLFLSPLVAEL